MRTQPDGVSPDQRPAGHLQYATFHPTFLYELIWNLLLASFLIWLWRRRTVRAPGTFALYVSGYSLARMGERRAWWLCSPARWC